MRTKIWLLIFVIFFTTDIAGKRKSTEGAAKECGIVLDNKLSDHFLLHSFCLRFSGAFDNKLLLREAFIGERELIRQFMETVPIQI